MNHKALLERSKNFAKKKSEVQQVILQAGEILHEFGIPIDNLSARRAERMCMAFLAVADVAAAADWNKARDLNTDERQVTTRYIIAYVNGHFQENISSGSYDDIRRKDLSFPVLAGLIVPTKPLADRNDSSRGYALSTDFAPIVRQYGSTGWLGRARKFMAGRATVAERLSQERSIPRVPIIIDSTRKLSFSPGPHNQLQKAVVEQFLPRYGFGAEILYLGDTEKRHAIYEKEKLLALGFPELPSGKLPDIVAFSTRRGWFYLIEAVHSSGPVSAERLLLLQELTKGCRYPVVYVTAFLTVEVFRKYAKQIAWETEVWIAEKPDHMIHYDGEKFLGPQTSV